MASSIASDATEMEGNANVFTQVIYNTYSSRVVDGVNAGNLREGYKIAAQARAEEEARLDALLEEAFEEFKSSCKIEAINAFEKRGVKLELFQRMRTFCLSKNSTLGYWSIGRLSALIIGNHEILTAGNRWEAEGAVDPSSTLTYSGQCSLVEMIRKGCFEAPDTPLCGGLHYQHIVGEKADIFVSFAYSCDFLELVDALECFFERTPSLDKNSTYLWFDLFVNDQWKALDKPFEWWASTFKEAVEEIGHTVVILLPWEAPIPLTRVWCLFEIACSKKMSIALSRKQVSSFQHTLQDCESIGEISHSLFKIDVEKATSFLPEDKERIFSVVRASEGGFHGCNVKITEMMRAWIRDASNELVEKGSKTRQVGIDAEETALHNLFRLGNLCHEQGNFDEAERMFRQALVGFERLLGTHHPSTLTLINNLGLVLFDLGRLEEAEQLWMRALQGREQLLGLDDEDTLTSVMLLGTLYCELGKTRESEMLHTRALQGFERVSGEGHQNTLNSLNNLGNVYYKQGRDREAEEMWTRAMVWCEKNDECDSGTFMMAVHNLAGLYYKQERLAEAGKMFKQALEGCEKAYGHDHPRTLVSTMNMASFHANAGELETAEAMYLRAFCGFEKTLGASHVDTIDAANSLRKIQKRQRLAKAATKGSV